MNDWLSMILNSGFNWLLIILYSLLVIGAGIYLSWMAIQRQKNMSMMGANIKNKLKANIHLSPKNIVHIGRGYNLTAKMSRDVVYNLYATIDDAASHAALDALVADIEKEELFDDLPDEVKPSMLRLTKLVDNSTEFSDKQVLSPITRKLNEYVELKAEQEKAKKQTYRAYLITVISFMVGILSFYYTIKTPSGGDIKKTVEEVFNEKMTSTQIDPPPPAKAATEKPLPPGNNLGHLPSRIQALH
jgi:hypothetical protein